MGRHSQMCISPYVNPFAAIHDPEWLAESIPSNVLVIYGAKEVMAGDIAEFTKWLEKVSRGEIEIRSRWKKGWHVWPLVLMYLGKDSTETESGVKMIAEYITSVMNIK